MSMRSKFTRTARAAAGMLLALSAPAAAGGLKDDGGREFSWSVNAAVTSDYVFRGVSQSDNDPALQGGIDFAYGILYAGAWASSVDEDFVFGNLEIDYYVGIKPEVGPATFDFGLIYYTYPGATDAPNGENEVLELKAGVSGDLVQNLTASGYVYYSPEALDDFGEYYVVEGTLAYALPKISVFEP